LLDLLEKQTTEIYKLQRQVAALQSNRTPTIVPKLPGVSGPPPCSYKGSQRVLKPSEVLVVSDGGDDGADPSKSS
jgi:hypothetical protein